MQVKVQWKHFGLDETMWELEDAMKYYCHWYWRQGDTTYFQDKYWKIKIVGNIVFGFLIPQLDTLYLKACSLQLPR